jgi:hypothetical protein
MYNHTERSALEFGDHFDLFYYGARILLSSWYIWYYSSLCYKLNWKLIVNVYLSITCEILQLMIVILYLRVIDSEELFRALVRKKVGKFEPLVMFNMHYTVCQMNAVYLFKNIVEPFYAYLWLHVLNWCVTSSDSYIRASVTENGTSCRLP